MMISNNKKRDQKLFKKKNGNFANNKLMSKRFKELSPEWLTSNRR